MEKSIISRRIHLSLEESIFSVKNDASAFCSIYVLACSENDINRLIFGKFK